MTNQQRFDDYFFTICKETGGIEGVLQSMMDFLYRRTDFFYEAEPGDKMGFLPGYSRHLLVKVFDRYQEEHFKRFPQKNPEDVARKVEEHNKKQKALTEANKTAAAAAKTPATTSQTSATTATAATTVTATATTNTPAPSKPVGKAAEKVAPVEEVVAGSEKKETTAYKSSGTPISIHNGGENDKYRWAQSMTDVSIEIALPRKVRAKELSVQFQSTHLSVHFITENNRCLLSGELAEKIKVDDSLWNLDDNLLQITLEKGVDTIWKSVLKGDPEIDATKVENSKPLESFDSETQSALRKIMYEQQRKQMGLPTLEEESQMEALKSAWDAEGSPFKGQPFDPSKFNLTSGQGGMNFPPME